MEECKLMSKLRHPHIVQFMGVCYLPGSQLPVLLMEKLLTSLDSLLETSPDIPLDVKVYLLTGTGRGMVFLHSHTPPIVHRDLTARNILIDSSLTAKIADLGVAKMVNVQPGQVAATMTRAPGNALYMPPEAVQEKEITRYNASIDIFSFGVISLFTLTQVFPCDLKPHNYFDPVTRRLLGRTEIERREDYVELMKTALKEGHPLVQLTLSCLDHFPEHRPSAGDVLRRLTEFEATITQNCADSKLDLIRQITAKDVVIDQLTTKEAESQAQVDQLQLEVQQLQQRFSEIESEKQALESKIDHLQTEKLEELRQLEQKLEVQHLEISQLSNRPLSQTEALEDQPHKSKPKRVSCTSDVL